MRVNPQARGFLVRNFLFGTWHREGCYRFSSLHDAALKAAQDGPSRRTWLESRREVAPSVPISESVVYFIYLAGENIDSRGIKMTATLFLHPVLSRFRCPLSQYLVIRFSFLNDHLNHDISTVIVCSCWSFRRHSQATAH